MSILRGVGLPAQFSHQAAKDLAGYMSTRNMGVTQAFAIDGSNAENVQTTGTNPVMINGDIILSLPVDTELDISADAQLGAWASGASYTTYHMRYTTDANGLKTYWMCIADHTSSATNAPEGSTGLTYWKKSNQTAEAAVGQSIPEAGGAWYACLATKDGVLTLVKASAIVADDANWELKIPKFEPEMFVLIGLLSVAPTSGAHVLGTTDLTTVGVFYQVLSSVVPHSDNL